MLCVLEEIFIVTVTYGLGFQHINLGIEWVLRNSTKKLMIEHEEGLMID